MPRSLLASAITTAWLGLGAALVACGAGAAGGGAATTPASDATGEPSSEPRPEREADAEATTARIHIALELEDLMNVRDPGKDQTRVTLVVTGERGESERHVLGVFAGVCADAEVGAAEAGLPRPALAGADCRGGPRVSRVRILRDGSGVVAVRAFIDDAENADEFPSFDEIQRLDLPAGADVVTGDLSR